MSIHKLTAGSGYDYLTRQVAAFDATSKGHVGLASYYAERGESPGVWIGSGMVGIDGLQAGDAVTAEQMLALFGAGMHPLAAQRLEQLSDTDLTEDSVRAATRLGAPFKVMDTRPNRFQIEVAKGFAAQAGSADAASIGVIYARKWRGSPFRPNTGDHRPMSVSWPPQSRGCRGHQRSLSPATTSPSPPSSRCRRCGQ